LSTCILTENSKSKLYDFDSQKRKTCFVFKIFEAQKKIINTYPLNTYQSNPSKSPKNTHLIQPFFAWSVEAWGVWYYTCFMQWAEIVGATFRWVPKPGLKRISQLWWRLKRICSYYKTTVAFWHLKLVFSLALPFRTTPFFLWSLCLKTNIIGWRY
jgi:hypothetical protein